MQLPRGTFREIKKNKLVNSILDELEHTKFSGICNILYGPESGTLVLKSGQCILAKIRDKSGNGALDELLKMSNLEVDAGLSSLDEAQIQLALEFNEACRIVKAGKTASVKAAQPQKPSSVVHNEPVKKTYPLPHSAAAPVRQNATSRKPAPLTSPALRPSSSFTTPPKPVKKVIPPPQARALTTPPPAAPVKPFSQMPVFRPSYSNQPRKPAETEVSAQDSSNFEKDIDTFDSLDLDNVTDKIRNDCKTMIKQLQLEHLMGR
jgi:hypothetical protein